MNQLTNSPEFILEESEKTHLTAKQLDNFVQNLLDLGVDIKVLSTELSKLEGFSGRIGEDIRALGLCLADILEREH